MIPAGTRIFACTEPLDLRLSFDGLVRAAEDQLGEDPEGGALFVFVNKRMNRLKVLWFDHNGYCILYKRLHRARFRLPDATERGRAKAVIDAATLAWIIRGIDRV